MHVRHFSRKVLLIAAAMIFALPLALEAAKPIPVTVTAANPADATQGEELDVIITGSGFDSDSSVSYLVTGTTDGSQVVVQSVQFLSSTQLKTRIKVNGNAAVTDYDIQVQNSTGRKGKGTTLFEVKVDPAKITAIDLGVAGNCISSIGEALNNGAYPAQLMVAGNVYSCRKSPQYPRIWQNGAWINLGFIGDAIEGGSSGVSDNGTIVGSLTSNPGKFRDYKQDINSAFVVDGGIMKILPLLNGMTEAYGEGISENGRFAYGTNNSGSSGTGSAVRWSRDAGGAWSAELIGDVAKQQPYIYWTATGSSDDGSVIVGYGFYSSAYADPALRGIPESWIWMESGSPQWVSLGLRARVHDIDPTGTMLVGTRYQDNGDTTFTPVATYWTVEDGFSVRHDLVGMGAEGSVAKGVGRLQNGDLVIVGEADTLGGQSQAIKAVAWLPQSPGVYGPPTHLAAINGSSSQFAGALDVNANGVVVGYSDTGGGRRAVLWQLPGTP